MFMVMKNADMAEGRGPFVNDRLFESLQNAEAYIDMKPGIMGSFPKCGRIKVHRDTGSYGDCYRIVEISVVPATDPGPDEIIDKDWTTVISQAKGVVNDLISGEYHEDNDDTHYIYEEVMKAVFGPKFFDWFNNKV